MTVKLGDQTWSEIEALTVAELIERLSELPPDIPLRSNEWDSEWDHTCHRAIVGITNHGYIQLGLYGSESGWESEEYDEED